MANVKDLFPELNGDESVEMSYEVTIRMAAVKPKDSKNGDGHLISTVQMDKRMPETMALASLTNLVCAVNQLLGCNLDNKLKVAAAMAAGFSKADVLATSEKGKTSAADWVRQATSDIPSGGFETRLN